MFNRVEIKQGAKGSISQLSNKGNLYLSALIIIIAMVLANITKSEYLPELNAEIRSTTTFSAIFGLLITNTAFVVSKSMVFMNFVRKDTIDLNDFKYGFQIYKQSFLTMFLVNLFTTLWTLLLIVPGVIKGIQYSMTRYIIADNPNLKPRDAIDISGVITYGYKADIFVMGLSFLGWIILTGLTAGIAGLYTVPYMETSYAMLYEKLKSDAIAAGKVPPEAFGINVNEQEQEQADI